MSFESEAKRLKLVREAITRIAKSKEPLKRSDIFPTVKGYSTSWQYKVLTDLVASGYIMRCGLHKSSNQKFAAVENKCKELLEKDHGVQHLLWPSTNYDEQISHEDERPDTDLSETESIPPTFESNDEAKILLETFTDNMKQFCTVLDRFDARLSNIETTLKSIQAPVHAPAPNDKSNEAIFTEFRKMKVDIAELIASVTDDVYALGNRLVFTICFKANKTPNYALISALRHDMSAFVESKD